MKNIPRSVKKRLPIYLHYLNNINHEIKYISSTKIANDLKLGEVLVRKDLALISGKGKPKIGYLTNDLKLRLEEVLNTNQIKNAIIIGAGKLGQALQFYEGFAEIGIKIICSFDNDINKIDHLHIYHINELEKICQENDVEIGIVTVNDLHSQEIVNLLIKNNIKKIWNFSNIQLNVPNNVTVKNENLAASLAVLSLK